MSTIMVVDDIAIFRDPIAASLRFAGFHTVTACNGKEALAKLEQEKPDLILLDLGMPEMDGIQFLTQRQNLPNLRQIPIILLTALAEKKYVLQAAQFGVHDYLLKSRFSLPELLARIGKYVAIVPPTAAPAAAATTAAPAEVADPIVVPAEKTTTPPVAKIVVAAPAPTPKPTPVPSASAGRIPRNEIPCLVTRDDSLARATTALQGKSLSGIITQVITMASSPRTNLVKLAELISKDPMLSAKILHASNSVAYLSARGGITNINDAVRQVGCVTIKNIATVLGLFEFMPAESSDGFCPIRCWQHSFAVAKLCETMAGKTDMGIAYLVGLCHDLGEILFRTEFGPEYQQLLAIEPGCDLPRMELERIMLGLTSGELATMILKSLGLPAIIQEPIEAFHAQALSVSNRTADRMLRILNLSELLANGMLLPSTLNAAIRPIRLSEWRQAIGAEIVTLPTGEQLRCEVFTLSALLGRHATQSHADLMKPMLARNTVRILLAREPSLCYNDPIAEALNALAYGQVIDHLPTEAPELQSSQALIITSPKPDTPGFERQAIEVARRLNAPNELPTMWMVGHKITPSEHKLQPMPWSITLTKLSEFVQTLV